MSDISAGVKEVMDAVTQFRAFHDKRLSEQDERLDEIEKVFNRTGALPSNKAPDTTKPNDDLVLKDGTRVRVMRSAEDFRAHYRAAASREGVEGVTLADFLRGAANMSTTTAARNALSVGTDSAGGFAVPSLLMPGILAAMTPASSLLSAGAGVVALDQGAKTFTTAAIDSIPTAAWRLEKGNIAESEPSFRAVVAQPQSLSFYFKISRELLADAADIDAALRTVIAQAFAKELDRAGLRGSGTAPEPRGLLNTSGIQSVTNGTNGASLGGWGNFFSAAQTILQADCPLPSAAIMSPRSLVKLGGLTDSTGQPLRRPELLSGLKLLSTSQVPNNLVVGSSNDCSEIYIGDFSRMAFVMRENVSVQVLKEHFSLTGEIGFVGHVRADVAVSYPKCFAIATGVRG